MYKVIATYKTGRKVNYTYEGDGDYQVQFETVEERIKRHFNKESITSYEVIKIN